MVYMFVTVEVKTFFSLEYAGELRISLYKEEKSTKLKIYNFAEHGSCNNLLLEQVKPPTKRNSYYS